MRQRPPCRGLARPQLLMPASLPTGGIFLCSAVARLQPSDGPAQATIAGPISPCEPAPWRLPSSSPCSANQQHEEKRHVMPAVHIFFIVSILWNDMPAYCPYQVIPSAPAAARFHKGTGPAVFSLPCNTIRKCPEICDAPPCRHKRTKKPVLPLRTGAPAPDHNQGERHDVSASA